MSATLVKQMMELKTKTAVSVESNNLKPLNTKKPT